MEKGGQSNAILFQLKHICKRRTHIVSINANFLLLKFDAAQEFCVENYF